MNKKLVKTNLKVQLKEIFDQGAALNYSKQLRMQLSDFQLTIIYIYVLHNKPKLRM